MLLTQVKLWMSQVGTVSLIVVRWGCDDCHYAFLRLKRYLVNLQIHLHSIGSNSTTILCWECTRISFQHHSRNQLVLGPSGRGPLTPASFYIAHSEIDVESWHHLEVLVMRSFKERKCPASGRTIVTVFSSPPPLTLLLQSSPSSPARPVSASPWCAPDFKLNRLLGSRPKSWASMSKRHSR